MSTSMFCLVFMLAWFCWLQKIESDLESRSSDHGAQGDTTPGDQHDLARRAQGQSH